ncbi:MAG: hypothetical protein PHI58_03815 [Candidatus Omnitrophica bacterium]|nr:hypothetical protein [Candidatus Omnitrophota bacterium]
MGKKRLVIGLFFLLFLLVSTALYADIKLKIAVVNPSEIESQTTPVRYDLPKGMTPDIITDAGNMELKYDFDKNNYYLYQVVKLKPSEKLVLEIKLKDMWIIPAKYINFLKEHTRAMNAQLANTRHAKSGDTLTKKIIDRLDGILKKGADQTMTMGEHINLYYENLGILGEVKEDIGMLEDLVLDVGGIVEERVQVPATLAIPIKTDEKNRAGAVDMTIEVTNPSKTSKQTTKVKYVLPEEVAPRYVIDRGDLDMGYDFTKQSFYVYKDSVMLDPSETKTFVIKIMDVWQVPALELDTLKAHTDNLMTLLKGTEYMAQAKPMADKITASLNEIRRTQALKVSAEEHIAYYRDNEETLTEAKSLVNQLEKFVSQSGASAGVTVKEAEVQKGGGPKEKRARGYEGIDYIVRSIFKGKAPTVATTWKIIYTILIFLGILAALFFGLWFVQVKQSHKRGESIGPVEKRPAEKPDMLTEEKPEAPGDKSE